MGKENIRWCRWECEKKSFKMFRIKSFWKKKNRLVPTCVLLFTRKTKHTKFSEKRTFLTPWYAPVRVRIRRQEMFVFRKIWRALFSCNARFEIRPYDIYTFGSSAFFTAWRVSKHGVFSSPYFPYSVQIRENTAQKKLLI